jgi:hypothetical protein
LQNRLIPANPIKVNEFQVEKNKRRKTFCRRQSHAKCLKGNPTQVGFAVKVTGGLDPGANAMITICGGLTIFPEKRRFS